MRKFLGVLALSIAATAVAYAGPPSPPPPGGWTQPKTGWTQSELQAIDNWLDQFGEKFEDWWYATWGAKLGITDPDEGSGSSHPASAPELDPAAALAALTLLAGGLAAVRGRRSKQ